MWPDRRLCDLLGIEHPIIQAPVAGSATPELAAAVCEAGGLGSLGCASMTLDQVRGVNRHMRVATNRPFNLNFFVHPAPEPNAERFTAARERLRTWYQMPGLGEPATEPPQLSEGFDSAKLALLLEVRPPVASFHFGLPGNDAVRAMKAAGIVIMSTASTVAEALALLKNATDTDTMVTESVSGRSARTVRSKYAEDMERNRQALPEFPSMYALSDALTEAGQDDVANFHLYGQAAALNVELPAGTLMARLVEQTQTAIARLS